MKVFITGGMGFIGSAIVVDLLSHGHEVTILARDPGKVPSFQTTPGIRIAPGGLSDDAVIAKNLPGHDALIHNALFWGNTPIDMLLNDTLSSVKIFAAAEAAGVKDVIYTSSTAALGVFQEHMDEDLKLRPSDYYGATKAATEAYLLAFSKRTPMRCNVVRPGYTVGNPVVPGAPIENDKRFKEIVTNAKTGADIVVTKRDGTQFIAATDLAKIYSAILHSDVNHEVYYGLGTEFTSWEAIANKTVEILGSQSKIVVEDKGYGETPHLFDLGKIKREFGLEFVGWPTIVEHLDYLISAAD